MWSTKGLLLAAPTLVSLFLLQSYFWVPAFEDQARGDPGRLTRYISASIGDASILNPTLAADTASSEINALVFEGLIDRNLDLSFRGRLAESWRISEEAYLYADESVRLRDGPGRRRARSSRGSRPRAPRARRSSGRSRPWRCCPAETETVQLTPPPSGPPARGAPPPAPMPVTIRRPPRIKFTLAEVDQDFFPELDRLLGGYATTLDPLRYVTAPTPELARLAAEEHVQPTEANPVIVFTLRPRRPVPRRPGAHGAGRASSPTRRSSIRGTSRPACRTSSRSSAWTRPMPARSASRTSGSSSRASRAGRWASCPSTSSIGSGSPPRRAPPARDPAKFTRA